jgi:hypothetical protein
MKKRKKKVRYTTDHLRGIVRGDAFESDCAVTLVTKLTYDSAVGVWASLRITAENAAPPDGIYRLEVHGRTFNVHRVGGKWPTLHL